MVEQEQQEKIKTVNLMDALSFQLPLSVGIDLACLADKSIDIVVVVVDDTRSNARRVRFLVFTKEVIVT